jgi:cell shape-determining protein MreC
MKQTRTILVALAVFSVLFVITELFFIPKTYTNSAILRAFQAPRVFIDSLINTHLLIVQLQKEQLENQSLRAQLAGALERPGIIKEKKETYLQAPVYSIYPLSNTGRMLIAAGSEEGVVVGQVVAAQPGIFVGEVIKVYTHQSEVRTLYDPDWELPVKIGDTKIDSLLVGGHEPLLTLISKKKGATEHMPVYLAAKQYPYGLLVGSLGEATDSDKNLFEEAPLVLPYQISQVDSVYLLVE